MGTGNRLMLVIAFASLTIFSTAATAAFRAADSQPFARACGKALSLEEFRRGDYEVPVGPDAEHSAEALQALPV